MNDIEKQEPTPSESEQAEPNEATVETDSTQTPSKAPTKLALIALIVALGGSVMAYMQLSDLNDALLQEKQALADLKKQQQATKAHLDKSDQAISAQQTAFTQQDERLKLQTDEMKQSLDLVYERVGRSSTQWIVAEAEYLMRIANHRLQLEGDSATALVALGRADRRLHDSGDPAWTAVREKLAAEMAELKGLRQLDLAGQAAKLSGLIAQVEKLKLPHSAPAADERPEDGPKEEKEFSFDRILTDFWSGVKSLLKVRRHDRPVTTMLEPDQRFFLYQDLRLQLEGARFALLRRDQALFDASLQRAETWIKEFFDLEHALTKGMLDGVKELKGLELQVKMPDISGSLRLLLEQQGQVYEEQKPAEQEQAVQNEGQAQVEEEQKPAEQKQPVEEQATQVAEEPKQADEQQVKEEPKQSDQEQKQPELQQGEIDTEQKETP